MTFFVSAYDTEFIRDPNHSLKAVETITEIHRGHDAPATFFIVGRLLEKAGERFRTLLEEKLFDVQSHTYTHSGLTNPWMPPEPEPWMPFGLSVKEEVEKSVRLY